LLSFCLFLFPPHFWEDRRVSAGPPTYNYDLTNALDLAHQNLLGPLPSRWKAELQALRDRCVLGPNKRERLECPSCTYAYDDELPSWTRSPVYLGQNRWLAVKVLSRVWEEGPNSSRGEQRPGQSGEQDQDQEALLAAREEEIVGILFRFWRNVLQFADHNTYRARLADLLSRFGNAEQRAGNPQVPLLQHLTAVGLPERGFRYPAPIRKVLSGVESHTVAYALKATYVSLLTFLRHLLRTALRRRYLPEREFKLRDDVLEHLEVNAKAAVVLKSPDGLSVEMEVGPDTRGDFPEANKPDLYGLYYRYINCSLRRKLLDLVTRLVPGAPKKQSFLSADGVDLLGNVFVRNFLALEVYLRPGTTLQAVTCCTLGQFLTLFDQNSEPQTVAFVRPEQEYHWVAALDEVSKTEVVTAEGSVVSAVASYAKCIRPAFLGPPEQDSSDHLPLFPLCGGKRMRTLVSCMYVFFKLLGEKPPGVDLTPRSVHHLKEDLVKEIRIKAILRSGITDSQRP
jgi:hypothetical protein